ncbi:MAG: NADH-quinone oxidoreductase subunit H, partial [Blastocatellia bacterium]
YTSIIVTSAVAVTLYLGGWSLFGLEDKITNETLKVVIGMVVFSAKVGLLIYIYMWFRWTFPRYRYDQLMDVGWKWLIPAALANIVLTGIWYVLALPASQGGIFGFLESQAGRYTMTGWGVLYFAGTGFLISIPLVWLLLATINRRSRDFNLHAQRQLQIQLRRERIEQTADAQAAE